MIQEAAIPFSSEIFKLLVKKLVRGPAQKELVQSADKYGSLTASEGKATAIQHMMEVLDLEAAIDTRREVMEACGRRCISNNILKKAVIIRNQSADLDDLLVRLNNAHIGGGHLWREGNVILAEYKKCYCGSVSKTRERFSATYCYCSCGWYRQLFETILEKPVTVELLGSIIQGDSCCSFKIIY